MIEQDKSERQVVKNSKIAIATARAERLDAELADLRTRLKHESDTAGSKAEQKLGMLRLVFMGISMLMFYLGLLVYVNWNTPGIIDNDGIGMAFFQTSKDIILVLTGILGSAMANVFDSGRSGSGSGSKVVDTNPDSDGTQQQR